jgi:hypothetical protein
MSIPVARIKKRWMKARDLSLESSSDIIMQRQKGRLAHQILHPLIHKFDQLTHQGTCSPYEECYTQEKHIA